MSQIFDDVTSLASVIQDPNRTSRDTQIESLANRQLVLGSLGATYENGTTAITGQFGAIQALSNTVFALLTASDWSGDSTASLPLPAGGVIYGQFTAFTLTSGSVVAYKR